MYSIEHAALRGYLGLTGGDGRLDVHDGPRHMRVENSNAGAAVMTVKSGGEVNRILVATTFRPDRLGLETRYVNRQTAGLDPLPRSRRR